MKKREVVQDLNEDEVGSLAKNLTMGYEMF